MKFVEKEEFSLSGAASRAQDRLDHYFPHQPPERVEDAIERPIEYLLAHPPTKKQKTVDLVTRIFVLAKSYTLREIERQSPFGTKKLRASRI